MCSFTKKLQLLGDFVPRPSTEAPLPSGPRWETSVCQTSSEIEALGDTCVRRAHYCAQLSIYVHNNTEQFC